MQVLFLKGLPNDNRVVMRPPRPEQGIPLDLTGSAAVSHYLGADASIDVSHLLLYGGNEPQPLVIQKRYDAVFNEIADPDTHGMALQRAHQLAETCQANGIAVVNLPLRVMKTSRDQISQTLKEVPGIETPLVYRIRPQSPDDVFQAANKLKLAFPLLIRSAGEHGGKTLTRLTDADDRAPFYPLALDGRTYYLSRFINFQDEDGWYRKVRLAVVDGEPYPRHLIASRQWCIHSESRTADDRSLLAAEQAFFDEFDVLHRERLRSYTQKIAALLGLEYFGIDAAMRADGRLLIFECNASMNMLLNNQPRPNIFEAPIERITLALRRMLAQAAARMGSSNS